MQTSPRTWRAITEWIRQRISYVPGSSDVHDSAEDTLLTGMGTCRDFAHLGIALCRATGIPARFAAVYAPGSSRWTSMPFSRHCSSAAGTSMTPPVSPPGNHSSASPLGGTPQIRPSPPSTAESATWRYLEVSATVARSFHGTITVAIGGVA
jgi:hypothetical protein